MENFNQQTTSTTGRPDLKERNRSGRFMGGFVIVIVGMLFLARELGAEFPRWLFSFESLLIALGVYLGFRHSFKGFGWMIPILAGVFFLLDDIYPYADLKDFFWPVAIISLGLYIMFRPSKKVPDPVFTSSPKISTIPTSSDDVIDSVVVFGGIKKNIISKNFRGGEAVTIFGGTEINLTQADVSGKIILELTQVFGGTKVIVPAHWKIQSDDVVAILGGVEDKRLIRPDSPVSEEKVLILRGTCIFGGIDIKSF